MDRKPNLIKGDYLRNKIREDHPNFCDASVDTWLGDSGRIFEALILATPTEEILAALDRAGFRCSDRYAAAKWLRKLVKERRQHVEWSPEDDINIMLGPAGGPG